MEGAAFGKVYRLAKTSDLSVWPRISHKPGTDAKRPLAAVLKLCFFGNLKRQRGKSLFRHPLAEASDYEIDEADRGLPQRQSLRSSTKTDPAAQCPLPGR
jgi:hypothetical protein